MAAATDDDVYAIVHAQLRAAAHRQLRGRGDGTLCTTALVHEAWIKLARAQLQVRDHEHYLALATRAMRQIVVDAARRSLADKRGGQQLRVTLDTATPGADGLGGDVLALDAALGRLETLEPRLAKVVEWRFFGGLGDTEIASLLGVTERTVGRDWRKARAFLHSELGDGGA